MGIVSNQTRAHVVTYESDFDPETSLRAGAQFVPTERFNFDSSDRRSKLWPLTCVCRERSVVAALRLRGHTR